MSNIISYLFKEHQHLKFTTSGWSYSFKDDDNFKVNEEPAGSNGSAHRHKQVHKANFTKTGYLSVFSLLFSWY